MGIDVDEDVIKLEPPTAEEMENYEDDTGPAPTLHPLRPDFRGVIFRSQWNNALCELFVEEYEVEYGLHLTPKQKMEVEDMFEARLERLKRTLRKYCPLEGESEGETRRRVEKTNDRRLLMQRRSSRRDTVGG